MFILGLLKSALDGFGAVFGKSRLETMEFGEYQKTYTTVNFLIIFPISLLMFYILRNGEGYKPIGLDILGYLVFYLFLRILSNLSQNKLLADKEMDVNTINILMAYSTFLSLFGCIKDISAISVCAMLLSCLGVILVTIDFKRMSFKFSRKSLILLIIAFIANGTRTLMCNHLLNYFSPLWLSLIELGNYAIVYQLMFRNAKISKANVIRVLPLSLICAVCLPLSFVVAKAIQISIITSFASTVSTALFAFIILKKRLKLIECAGITLVLIGLAMFKIYCI